MTARLVVSAVITEGTMAKTAGNSSRIHDIPLPKARTDQLEDVDQDHLETVVTGKLGDGLSP
ncbi:hypothetical protein OK351_16755 [Glutamicibacter sp. MNS18]|uniref:hypothetical protein n=1 Tax=Glutamicibacter sp. MNS18 TaxID=2989817 RepID=UPI0022359BAE|nr:hypothetical protein [Glutamicibacter sp. MNS18]MCW4467134.1 hypothetical protein [Glutamicibacter sp. MNS18]